MAIECFKIIHDLSPPCLSDLVSYKNSSYNFRYSNLLEIPHVRTTTYGKKSFKYAAPILWNQLPENFRSQTNFLHFRNLISNWTGKECKCNVCSCNWYFLLSLLVFSSLYFACIVPYIIISLLCALLQYSCYVYLVQSTSPIISLSQAVLGGGPHWVVWCPITAGVASFDGGCDWLRLPKPRVGCLSICPTCVFTMF